jgi:hypothetical protein
VRERFFGKETSVQVRTPIKMVDQMIGEIYKTRERSVSRKESTAETSPYSRTLTGNRGHPMKAVPEMTLTLDGIMNIPSGHF